MALMLKDGGKRKNRLKGYIHRLSISAESSVGWDRIKLRQLVRTWIASIVCSQPWASACEDAIGTTVPERTKKDRQIHQLSHTGFYPPGGNQTLMRQCGTCGKWTPPQCVGSNTGSIERDKYGEPPMVHVATNGDECVDCHSAHGSGDAPAPHTLRWPSFSRYMATSYQAMDSDLRQIGSRRRHYAKDDDGEYRVWEESRGQDGFLHEVVVETPEEAETALRETTEALEAEIARVREMLPMLNGHGESARVELVVAAEAIADGDIEGMKMAIEGLRGYGAEP